MIDYVFSLDELEYFLLILARVAGFVGTAPFFGINNVPRRVRLGLSIFITLLLYHITLPHGPLPSQTIWGYGVLVMKETLTGLLIGFGAQICTTVVIFSGMIIVMNSGLCIVNMSDHSTRQTFRIAGVFLQYITMVMLVVSGI